MKTIKFKKFRYIGDPINAVKIFNEKEVDELLLIDIDATREEREPHYQKIEDIVGEAFMPICYGGGVRSIEQIQRLFSLGVEKVSLCAAAIENPKLIEEAAEKFGKQSIIVTLDIKKIGFRKQYQVVTHNATKNTRRAPLETALHMERLGAGELLINNVDCDGVMMGYDLELTRQITDVLRIPVVALGGAGSLLDLQKVIKEGCASAASAGSLFVYQGKLRGVLINYPSQSELRALFQEKTL